MENNDKIKEVRNANDIIEVISSYISLTKKGKNYFGVCPFHDDNNPSMSVSSEKQIYKCFSCGASGNVFNFVMDYEKINFKEALELLAKRAGITLDTKYLNNKTNDKNDRFYKIYDLAEKMYQNNLQSKDGKEAKEYLYKRDISDELIKEFKIGLSLKDNNSLTKLLSQKDYNLKELSLLGLSNGDHDLFINRIMFPLFDPSGKPVGFSGRIYNNTSDSKYINTKETPIFKKGELLYNYHNGKDEARKEKYLIIVEGFMDVIRLYSVGIKNVIAIMGTSLTKEQITLIRRISTNIYLSLDGDTPGQNATYTIGNMLEAENFEVKVVELSKGLDPDEYIIKNGKESYLNLIENNTPFSNFKIKYLKKDKDLTTIEDQSKYINSVLNEIGKEKDDIKQELMLKQLELEFNIDIEILRKKLQNTTKYSKIETFQKKPDIHLKLDKYQKATYNLLYYMLTSYEATKLYQKKLNFLPYAEARFLANEIIYFYKQEQELVLADFLTTLNDKPELKNLVNTILQLEIEELENISVVEEYINVIKDYNSNLEITRLKKLIEEESDETKKAEIADKIRLVKIGS